VPIPSNDDRAIRDQLSQGHVAIIGCGGLGSNAAMMLVRAGLGRLTLIDFDTVDPSNLNRQMFFPDQIGQSKTAATALHLKRLNSDLLLTLHDVRVSAGNACALVGDADVVIEAVDSAAAKAEIANAILAAGTVPLVGASGIAGASSANDVVTERVADRYYLVGDHVSDVSDDLSLLASRVVAAAAHEAHMAVRLLLGYDEP